MTIKKKGLMPQLRAIVEGCGKSRYQLAKETGILESTLSRFVNDEKRGLSVDAINRLGENLGLEIVVRKRKGK